MLRKLYFPSLEVSAFNPIAPERPILYKVLAVLSAIGLNANSLLPVRMPHSVACTS